jgi:hypothetical protein
MKRIVHLPVALGLLGLLPTPPAAQPVQALYSPVIVTSPLAWVGADNRPTQMNPDGSGAMRIQYIGDDLTHNGVAGARYFIAGESDCSTQFPWDSPPPEQVCYVDFVAVHESGDPGSKVLLTSDRSLLRGAARWSADGTRVVYEGRRYDSQGVVVEAGAFIGEVDWAADGTPARIRDEHLVALDAAAPSLSGDGLRLAFGTSAGQFLVDVPRGSIGAPPAPAVPVRVLLASSNSRTRNLNFSPVPGDTRAWYEQRSGSGSPYAGTIRLVDVPPAYDGSYVLPTAELTTKSSAGNLYSIRADWSPDGQWIAFRTTTSGDWTTPSALYRIPSGGGKAVRLSPKNEKNGNYLSIWWR